MTHLPGTGVEDLRDSSKAIHGEPPTSGRLGNSQLLLCVRLVFFLSSCLPTFLMLSLSHRLPSHSHTVPLFLAVSSSHSLSGPIVGADSAPVGCMPFFKHVSATGVPGLRNSTTQKTLGQREPLSLGLRTVHEITFRLTAPQSRNP